MSTDALPYRERIAIDPGVLAGKPVIAGTRIPVSLILNLFAQGYDMARIQQAYPNLTDADIVAALTYAAELVDEDHVPTTPSEPERILNIISLGESSAAPDPLLGLIGILDAGEPTDVARFRDEYIAQSIERGWKKRE